MGCIRDDFPEYFDIQTDHQWTNPYFRYRVPTVPPVVYEMMGTHHQGQVSTKEISGSFQTFP